MRDRPLALTKPAARRTALAVDVVFLSPGSDTLAVLLSRAGGAARERWSLPWDTPRPGEGLEDAAARVATTVLGVTPVFFEQIGALADARRHPGDADVSIGIAALVPSDVHGGTRDAEWFPLDDLPALPPRHRTVVDRAASVVRQRVDQSPLAFRLLPSTFTLSHLQSVYELLLGRRLHQARFPCRVREEGYAIARAGPESLRAPVQTLHFYHQTLHLLGARPAARTEAAPATDRAMPENGQLEIPLRAAGG